MARDVSSRSVAAITVTVITSHKNLELEIREYPGRVHGARVKRNEIIPYCITCKTDFLFLPKKFPPPPVRSRVRIKFGARNR